MNIPSQSLPASLEQRCGTALTDSGAATPRLEQDRSWRTLLRSVPHHYVSAEFVCADVLRRYGEEGRQLLATWARNTVFAETDDDAPRSPITPIAGYAAFLEVTVNGRGVRAPSNEVCL
jgi:hypothetical protein